MNYSGSRDEFDGDNQMSSSRGRFGRGARGSNARGEFGSSSLRRKKHEVSKPNKVRCHNCKKPHLIEKCEWNYCMFCGSSLKGQHHRCYRLWVKEFFASVGDYRRAVGEVAANHGINSAEVKTYCSSLRKKYENAELKKCIFCSNAAKDPWLCKFCNAEIGCFECCVLQKKAGSCCQTCEYHSNVINLVTCGNQNNIRQGTLHILLRHYSEFINKISSPAKLSSSLLELIQECETASVPEISYKLLQSHLQSSEMDKEILDVLQQSLFSYIKKTMKMSNFLGTQAGNNGNIIYRFRVDREVLVVVLSNDLYYDADGTVKQEMLQIITSYLLVIILY